MEKVLLAGGGVGEGEGGTGGPSARIVEAGGMRVAIEGCCHGTLDEIYSKGPPTQQNNAQGRRKEATRRESGEASQRDAKPS